jgi:hypothetical protein
MNLMSGHVPATFLPNVLLNVLPNRRDMRAAGQGARRGNLNWQNKFHWHRLSAFCVVQGDKLRNFYPPASLILWLASRGPGGITVSVMVDHEHDARAGRISVL